jgi:hypothetical protein
MRSSSSMQGISSTGMRTGGHTMTRRRLCSVRIGDQHRPSCQVVVDGDLQVVEDARLVLMLCHGVALEETVHVMLCHGVTLEETVHAMDLQHEAIKLHLQCAATLLQLDTSHLQQHQTFLRMLLRLRDAALEPATAALNVVAKARLHLLQLIEEDTY